MVYRPELTVGCTWGYVVVRGDGDVLVMSSRPIILINLETLVLRSNICGGMRATSDLLSTESVVGERGVSATVVSLRLDGRGNLLLIGRLRRGRPGAGVVICAVRRRV